MFTSQVDTDAKNRLYASLQNDPIENFQGLISEIKSNTQQKNFEHLKLMMKNIKKMIKDNIPSKPKYYALLLLRDIMKCKETTVVEYFIKKMLSRLFLIAIFEMKSKAQDKGSRCLLKYYNKTDRENLDFNLKFYELLLECWKHWDEMYSKDYPKIKKQCDQLRTILPQTDKHYNDLETIQKVSIVADKIQNQNQIKQNQNLRTEERPDELTDSVPLNLNEYGTLKFASQIDQANAKMDQLIYERKIILNKIKNSKESFGNELTMIFIHKLDTIQNELQKSPIFNNHQIINSELSVFNKIKKQIYFVQETRKNLGSFLNNQLSFEELKKRTVCLEKDEINHIRTSQNMPKTIETIKNLPTEESVYTKSEGDDLQYLKKVSLDKSNEFFNNSKIERPRVNTVRFNQEILEASNEDDEYSNQVENSQKRFQPHDTFEEMKSMTESGRRRKRKFLNQSHPNQPLENDLNFDNFGVKSNDNYLSNSGKLGDGFGLTRAQTDRKTGRRKTTDVIKQSTLDPIDENEFETFEPPVFPTNNSQTQKIGQVSKGFNDTKRLSRTHMLPIPEENSDIYDETRRSHSTFNDFKKNNENINSNRFSKEESNRDRRSNFFESGRTIGKNSNNFRKSDFGLNDPDQFVSQNAKNQGFRKSQNSVDLPTPGMSIDGISTNFVNRSRNDLTNPDSSPKMSTKKRGIQNGLFESGNFNTDRMFLTEQRNSFNRNSMQNGIKTDEEYIQSSQESNAKLANKNTSQNNQFTRNRTLSDNKVDNRSFDKIKILENQKRPDQPSPIETISIDPWKAYVDSSHHQIKNIKQKNQSERQHQLNDIKLINYKNSSLEINELKKKPKKEQFNERFDSLVNRGSHSNKDSQNQNIKISKFDGNENHKNMNSEIIIKISDDTQNELSQKSINEVPENIANSKLENQHSKIDNTFDFQFNTKIENDFERKLLRKQNSNESKDKKIEDQKEEKIDFKKPNFAQFKQITSQDNKLLNYETGTTRRHSFIPEKHQNLEIENEKIIKLIKVEKGEVNELPILNKSKKMHEFNYNEESEKEIIHMKVNNEHLNDQIQLLQKKLIAKKRELNLFEESQAVKVGELKESISSPHDKQLDMFEVNRIARKNELLNLENTMLKKMNQTIKKEKKENLTKKAQKPILYERLNTELACYIETLKCELCKIIR